VLLLFNFNFIVSLIETVDGLLLLLLLLLYLMIPLLFLLGKGTLLLIEFFFNILLFNPSIGCVLFNYIG